MKLDYCNDHQVSHRKDLTCLRIRTDEGIEATPQEVWSYIEHMRAEIMRLHDQIARLQSRSN